MKKHYYLAIDVPTLGKGSGIEIMIETFCTRTQAWEVRERVGIVSPKLKELLTIHEL